jgi:GNAT superfamily N-acetyltransferase
MTVELLERVELRTGTTDDTVLLLAMHARCSAHTLRRRYHTPRPRITAAFARELLEPEDGTSVVAMAGPDLVGIGVLADGDDGPELGVLVEDGYQRRGLGTRLVHHLVREAADRSLPSVRCVVLPGNDAALPTLLRAGLRVHVAAGADGARICTVPVAVSRPVGRGRKPARGVLTSPLVSLLHQRADLRGIHGPADMVDRAVRDGA